MAAGCPETLVSVDRSTVRSDAIAHLVGCDPGMVRLLHRGFNDTYEIRDRLAVLRLYQHGWRSHDEISAELQILELLAQKNVPVAVPRRFSDGSSIAAVQAPEGARFAAMFEKAPGNLPGAVSSELAMKLGSVLGRLHKSFDALGSNWSRPVIDEEMLIERPLATLLLHFPDFREELASLRQVAGRLLKRVMRSSVAGSNRGLVHGDFIAVNLFEDRGGVTLFDFDFCGVSWRAYDLASWHWATNGDSEALFAGYEKETGVVFETDAIEALAGIRHLWVWGIGVEQGDDFRRLNVHQFRHRIAYFERFAS